MSAAHDRRVPDPIGEPFTPADMAALLRGEARICDGAAVALFARLGLTAGRTLSALPEARAITAQRAAARRPGT